MEKLIIEQLKHLSEDGSDFIRQLEQSKRALLGNRQSIMYCFAVLRTKCWLMLLWLRK